MRRVPCSVCLEYFPQERADQKSCSPECDDVRRKQTEKRISIARVASERMTRDSQARITRARKRARAITEKNKSLIVPAPSVRASKKSKKKKRIRAMRSEIEQLRAQVRSLGASPVASRKVIDKTNWGFYGTDAWRKLRYWVIKTRGRKCEACGTTKGAIHVDHIKPRSRYPELSLVESNLQILCENCNMGKGSWDETDWRNEGNT